MEVPPLEALIESPFLRSDGTICGSPDTTPAPASSTLRRLPSTAEDSRNTDADHVDVSLDLLDSAIGDFPFANEASRANAIASILTPVVRRPSTAYALALYDAPQAAPERHCWLRWLP